MSQTRSSSPAACIAAAALGLLCVATHAQEKPAASEQKVLRVCQDPNNLPMSDRQDRGYENKIAELIAKKLGWKLEHTWYPQRMGFIRNTLKAKIPDTETYKCDVVTGVSTDFDIGLPTNAYYTSTYALAYVKGKGLDGVKTPEDLLKLDKSVRDKLKIGVFGRSPGADWLLKNGLIEQMVSSQQQTGDPDQYPGQLIDRDLTNGTIDVAIAWGPIVGYFAKESRQVPIAVVPFKPEADGVRYGFSIAMGVRYGEKALRDQLNAVLESSRPEIAEILKNYGVPTVALPPLASKAGAPT